MPVQLSSAFVAAALFAQWLLHGSICRLESMHHCGIRAFLRHPKQPMRSIASLKAIALICLTKSALALMRPLLISDPARAILAYFAHPASPQRSPPARFSGARHLRTNPQVPESGLGNLHESASLGAKLFRYRRSILIGCLLFAIANTLTTYGVRPTIIKDHLEAPADFAYDRWNSFSRITVAQSYHRPTGDVGSFAALAAPPGITLNGNMGTFGGK